MLEKITKLLTKREQTILYLTGGVFVASLIFALLVMPLAQKNDQLNKEVSIAQTRLSKYQRLIVHKDLIKNKLSTFSSSFKLPDQNKDALVAALSELETLAQNAGIRIVDIRPETPRGEFLYKEILIDLRVEGSMEGYLKFIYGLETSPALLRIKKLQLTTKPQLQGLEGNFKISQISITE